MNHLKTFLLTCLILYCVAAFTQPIYTNASSSMGLSIACNFGEFAGGVSFVDFNGDGWDDLTMGTENGDSVHFYVNLAGTGFQLLSPDPINNTKEQKHLLWVDYDNDGDKDLYVCTWIQGNHLYQNMGTVNGQLNLVDVTAAAGLPTDNMPTFGACFGDYDNDGLVDLYITNRTIAYGISSHTNYLFHNLGNGTFNDVTIAAGVGNGGKAPFGASFLDFNLDGWQDIYVYEDKNYGNALFENNGNGTFTDISVSSGTNLQMDAMCTTIGDYNRDGYPDIYITNGPLGNALLHNNGGNGTFSNLAVETGTIWNGIGWGSVFLDYDHDQDLDLYVSGDYQGPPLPSSQLYINLGPTSSTGRDTFGLPMAAGFAGDSMKSFSSAIGDIDNNGYPDIAVTNFLSDTASLWKNNGYTHNWIKLRLEGAISNRDAIGSMIEIFSGGIRQVRWIHCGIGFIGQNSLTEMVGLGTNLIVDSIRVTWPSGIVDRIYGQNAGQTVVIYETSVFDLGQGESTDPIQDDLTGSRVRIFPHPITEHAYISFPVEEPKYYQLKIYDMTGRILLEQKGEGKGIELALGYLASGLYTFKLFVASKSYYGRMVKE